MVPHPFVRAFNAPRFMPKLLLSLALVSTLSWASTACAQQAGNYTPAQSGPYSAALKTEGLPIAFEPNLKQADTRYRFLAHQNGFSMGFLDHSIEIRLATKAGPADVLHIAFEGAQSSSPSVEKPLAGRANYPRGSDPAAFQRNVPT